jgi:transposase
VIEMQRAEPELVAPKSATPPPFVPVTMPSNPVPSEIRLELRRGSVAISVTWPMTAAAECAAWAREVLR